MSPASAFQGETKSVVGEQRLEILSNLGILDVRVWAQVSPTSDRCAPKCHEPIRTTYALIDSSSSSTKHFAFRCRCTQNWAPQLHLRPYEGHLSCPRPTRDERQRGAPSAPLVLPLGASSDNSWHLSPATERGQTPSAVPGSPNVLSCESGS